MRTAEQIGASAKPMFDRMSDGLKVAGSGNAAGLIGIVATFDTAQPEHTHTIVLLKTAAVIFPAGVVLFAIAYLFLMYSYVYLEAYLAFLHPSEQVVDQDVLRLPRALPSKDASVEYMKHTLKLGLACTSTFFVGFVTAFIALIRY